MKAHMITSVLMAATLSALSGFAVPPSPGHESEPSIQGPAFQDFTASAGAVNPAVGGMGFCVTSAEYADGFLEVTWVTDHEPPYDLAYCTSETNDLILATNLMSKSFRFSVPYRPEIIHVHVAAAGCLYPDTAVRRADRRRALHYPQLVSHEYYYTAIQRRTSPGVGGSYLSEDGDGTFRTFVHVNSIRFPYQIHTVVDGRDRVVFSSAFEDLDQGVLRYGSGYRVLVSWGDNPDIDFVRAFSTWPDRSDEKVIRVTERKNVRD